MNIDPGYCELPPQMLDNYPTFKRGSLLRQRKVAYQAEKSRRGVVG